MSSSFCYAAPKGIAGDLGAVDNEKKTILLIIMQTGKNLLHFLNTSLVLRIVMKIPGM